MVPLIMQCAGTVDVAATGVTVLTTVLATGRTACENASSEHAMPGATAFAILSTAAGSRASRVANTSTVLMPGTRPDTVPVSSPFAPGASDAVTLVPLSLTVARPSACAVAADTASGTLSPLVM